VRLGKRLVLLPQRRLRVFIGKTLTKKPATQSASFITYFIESLCI
jgi:hypothetical protein